jgi:Tfp pilus assembly protein PilF
MALCANVAAMASEKTSKKKKDLAVSGLLVFCLLISGYLAILPSPVSLLAGHAAGNSAQSDRGASPVLRHNNLGIAYLEQYDYRRASEEFQKALDIQPDFVPALVNIGIAYYYDTAYTKAVESFDKAIKISPRIPHAHYMLGVLSSKEKDRDKALGHFRHVLEAYPNDPATNYHLGLLFMRGRDYEDAIKYFETVLRAEPYNVSALYNLAMVYLRSGERERGQTLMDEFRSIKGDEQAGGAGGTMGGQYQEEGRFAMAISQYDLFPAASSGAVPEVRFVDVADSAGIRFSHGGNGQSQVFGRKLNGTEKSREWIRSELVSSFGSGVVFFDYNGDGKVDIYLVNSSPDPARSVNVLYRNDGNGRFSDVTAEAGVGDTGMGMGVAVGDFNNDGHPDLYVTNFGLNVLYRNEGNGTFTDVTERAGVGGLPNAWSLSAAFFDYDHDGDLDIYVTNFVDLDRLPAAAAPVFPDEFSGQPNFLLRNNGDGTFTDVAAQAGVAGRDKSASIVFTDFNESRDIDFWVINYGSGSQLFSNNRNGTFTDVAKVVPAAKRPLAFGIGSADLNRSGQVDVVFGDGRLLVNDVGKDYSETGVTGRAPVASNDAFGWASMIFDYDNDGMLDVLLVSDRLRLFRNKGRGEFMDVTEVAGLSQIRVAGRAISVADFDGDGDPDLLVSTNGGGPLLLRNEGGNRNNHVRINLVGLRDNKPALGAKVEIRAGDLWQKLEVTGNCGYLSQGTSEIMLGIGQRKVVEAIKILWPSGVLQAEIDPPVNSPIKIDQLDRKGTSCPILYAWDGSEYSFVTDFLGGSAVGYLLEPGQYSYPDTDEYILVTSDQLKLKDGNYSLKMVNQLEETIFTDEAKLLVIDHPMEVRVFPNERLMPGPPYPEFKIYATRDSRLPVSAEDGQGRDVLPQLSAIDRKYVEGFGLLPFKGYAEEHSLELDLGDLSSQEKILLLMTAWIDYADSSSNLAAYQAGVQLQPPYLQVIDKQGEWVTVLARMGFPAGLPKTMTVDLTGKFLTDDYRVRIVTNMRIYWDQILVDTHSAGIPMRVATLEAVEARLGWAGYPKAYSPDGKKPHIYDYSVRDQRELWKTHVGNYTRYGDVRSLLRKQDNQYVVMRHGDEITLEFDAGKLPALPAGWTRSYLVYAAGFGKDMDLNSAFADTIAPLPFHGMPEYPYAGEHPGGPEHLRYLEEYNTRRVNDPMQ